VKGTFVNQTLVNGSKVFFPSVEPQENELFDYVVTFSVFQHLTNLQQAKYVFSEMVKATKTGGWLMVGHVNDLAKYHYAPCSLRQRLFIPRQFWDDLAQEMNLDFYHLKIVPARDTYQHWLWFSHDPSSHFQYHVYVQKRGIVNG